MTGATVVHLNNARIGALPHEWAHFDLVLGLTQDLLPVVSNGSATISPDSKMGEIGKTPSTYNVNRKVVGIPQWTQLRATPEQIVKWSRERDYGLCIQTRVIRALDVDVPDPEQSAAIRRFIDARLILPARIRDNSSKFLLAFHYEGTLLKRRIKTQHGVVELLATGQQFVALGRHPSGVRYEWENGLPDEFPVMTLEQVESLWLALNAEFGIDASVEATATSKHQKLAEAASKDPVAVLLDEKGFIKRTERDGRLHITCPFESEHTTDSGDSSTTYWPAHTGGYVNGHFHCLHSHCEYRTDAEFLDAVGYVDQALLSEFEAIADEPMVPAEILPIEADMPKFRFAVVPAHTFASAAPQSWIIKGVIPHAELVVLFGESGSGKSFAVLDMVTAISRGIAWRGHKVRQGRVVYVAAEGAGGFRNRLKAYAHQHSISLADIPVGVIPSSPNLLMKEDALDIAKSIVHSGGADVVVIDTLAQTVPGGDENSASDMGKALAHCKGIHRATKAVVILVHHSGKDSSKGARGWSGLRAAADAELEVVRDDDARAIKITKQKDGDDTAEYGFRLEPVIIGFDDDGDEITSCVVMESDVTVQNTKKREPKGEIRKIVFNVLGESMDDEGMDREVLIAQIVEQLPQNAGRDRRVERAKQCIELMRDDGLLVANGTKLQILQK